MRAMAAGRKGAGLWLSVLAVAGLALWLGPRPIWEPWVTEEVAASGPRAEGLGLQALFAPQAGPARVQLFDADGDGDQDRFELGPGGDSGPPAPFSLQLDEGGGLREAGRLLGPAFAEPRRAKASACADLDRDGRMDLAVLLEDGSFLVLWNRLEQKKDRR
ncbi:MAG: VCBS repeat-containing protein [Planctomycetes bacterium]|nr:VCBS repeat-containing protein [Planctomycetota bacterium]